MLLAGVELCHCWDFTEVVEVCLPEVCAGRASAPQIHSVELGKGIKRDEMMAFFSACAQK